MKRSSPLSFCSRALVRAGCPLFAALTLSGCVTKGYKMADKDTPPAVPLNLTSAPASVATAAPGAGDDPAAPVTPEVPPAPEVTVNTVIVFQGPGSWKKEAYWDEYVATISNRTASPLLIESAVLHANSGETSLPGDNPWKIEKAGKTWWQSNAGQEAKTYLLLGGGAVAGAGVGVVSALSAGLFMPVTGAAAVGTAVGAAAFFALPVVAIGSVGMNLHRKGQVEAEFARRRLVLPVTLAPGQTVTGSLFFRVTPSPRELVIRSGTQEAPHATPVALTPLASLHLRFPVAAPKAP